MSYEEIVASLDSIRGQINLPPSSNLQLNPNHHLWNNHGTWWCHFTIHHRHGTAERVRVSLKTGDVRTARQRRDLLLTALA